jgi:alpha-tubulin suppressor-like RCC1 family protein
MQTDRSFLSNARFTCSAPVICLWLLLAAATSRGSQVVTWGYNLGPVPASLTTAVAIDVVGYSIAALRADGSVAQWGNSAGDPGVSNLITLVSGWSHGLGFRPDGTIAGWGDDTWGAVTGFPADLTNAAALACGFGCSFAVRPDGRVSAWGNNDYHALELPAALTNVVAIASSENMQVALRADGTAVEWGGWNNVTNFFPEWSNLVSVAHGGYSLAALQNDGVVVTWPDPPPTGLTNVTALAGGGETFLALHADGTVTAWGCDCHGAATPPAGLTNVSAVAMRGSDGYSHGAVLLGLPAPPAPGLSISVSGERVELTLSGLKYRRYVLEEATGVGPAENWRFRQNILLSAPLQHVASLPVVGESPRYYRVKLLP